MFIISYQNADSSQRRKVVFLFRDYSLIYVNMKVIVIGLVDGANTVAMLLRWSSNRSVNGKAIFTFKENDDWVIPGEDVHKKTTTHTTKTWRYSQKAAVGIIRNLMLWSLWRELQLISSSFKFHFVLNMRLCDPGLV